MSLLGLLTFTIPAIWWTQAHTRPLHGFLLTVCDSQQSSLPPYVKNSLLWNSVMSRSQAFSSSNQRELAAVVGSIEGMGLSYSGEKCMNPIWQQHYYGITEQTRWNKSPSCSQDISVSRKEYLLTTGSAYKREIRCCSKFSESPPSLLLTAPDDGYDRFWSGRWIPRVKRRSCNTDVCNHGVIFKVYVTVGMFPFMQGCG